MSQVKRRLALGFVFAFVVGTASGTAQLSQNAGRVDDHLTVHEWGTFTSVAGRDGRAAEWRPLDGPSDLPSFVYTREELEIGAGLRHGSHSLKASLETLVRMETPVIYFYTDRETDVSVRVDFPQGIITEWYPRLRSIWDKQIDWGRLKILPGTRPIFPGGWKDSHYYKARATDSAPVRVCGKSGAQSEKFLFYRGVASFPVPLSVRLEGDRIFLKNNGQRKIARLIVFENRGGKVGFRMQDGLEREATLERPAMDGTLDQICEELKKILTAEGLYEKEAQAMIATWRDSWFEEGLRVFYTFPRESTDEVLPLHIEPAPSKLVRVMVGRAEIITPEMESEIEQAVTGLRSSNAEVRNRATKCLQKHGRFAATALKRILDRTKDRGSRALISQLLAAQSSVQ
ncbi:MAG TPA: hypothetical protein VID27_04415 [Blastocatellia bacterium]|jgi:hypothetical protein